MDELTARSPVSEDEGPTQRPRIDAVDLARGTSVLFMPLVHALYMYGDRAIFDEATLFVHVMHVLGHGAPMFLFAMGLSFVLSRDRAPLASARRGVKMLAIAYGTTVVQFVVPILAGTMPEGFIEANGWRSPLTAAQYLHLVTEADILHLAGICLLFMGLTLRCFRSRRVVLGLALVVAAASGALHGQRLGVPLLDGVCDLLWGSTWNVYFPVVPWASPVLLGMAFGMHIDECGGDAAPAFARMLPVGAVLAAVGALLWWLDPALHYRDFFHIGPGGIIHLMGMTALAFWLVRRLEARLKPTWLGRLAIYCSPRVTSLYVTHWIVISWGMGIVGFREHGTAAVIALSVVVLVVTLAVEAAWRAAKTRGARASQASLGSRTSWLGSREERDGATGRPA